VISEYRTLRRVIMKLYGELGDIGDDLRPKMVPVRDLHSALDEAITDAVDQYAVDKDRAREMFIGMLGHDLREPLNTIAFTSDLLRERAADEWTRKAAARIRESAERMEAMISDLLDFARGRLGPGLPIVPAPIDARALINDTVEEIAIGHPERKIACLACSAVGDFDVQWDGGRIAQAISNLVANAIAHGGDPIVVDLFDRGDVVAIEVRNRGEIPAAVLPRLFEPFSQPSVDRRKSAGSPRDGERRRGHLGLGLYIVKEISCAHGGSVQADSRDGEAIFRIVLPRRSQRSHVAGDENELALQSKAV
jgi:signal transduction histidine kinase